MGLHAPGTFITDPLFYIPQNEKIAPNIAAKIVRVNGPLSPECIFTGFCEFSNYSLDEPLWLVFLFNFFLFSVFLVSFHVIQQP